MGSDDGQGVLHASEQEAVINIREAGSNLGREDDHFYCTLSESEV